MIVDDHELVREGLRAILEEDEDFYVVAEAKNGAEALGMMKAVRPQVVLLDLIMPVLDGIETAKQIKEQFPEVKVLMLTSFLDAAKVKVALQAGAIGYLLKDVRKDDLYRAIRDASEGRGTLHPDAQQALITQVVAPSISNVIEDLTAREQDVLKLIAKGRSNKEIGTVLGLTEGTVKGYVSAILAKIGVQDRTQAALFAVKYWSE